MTTSEYQNLTPREAEPGSASVLFSFARIRSGSSRRFYPGDGAKLHFANRDVDTLEIPGVPSGYLAAGDVVTATYKGVTVFRGDVATIVESKNRGTDATQTVTCVGPWSKMQRLVYRQSWNTGESNAYSSRLILNQKIDGTAQNLNSELTEILDHAPSVCGYTRGTVSVSTQILPSDECRDITIADAIKRELRLFPKAICRFDYSTDTPTLNILGGSRSVATASYVANVPKSAREYVYNVHPITGVDLEIESSDTINGVNYHNITHQRAGVTTSDNTTVGSPDCLYATLQIKGISSNTTLQSFKSVTEDFLTRYQTAAWWKEKHPRLANVAENAITISEPRRTGTLPRISAATAGELESAGLQCEVSKFTCKATIATDDDKEEDVYLTLNFLTTDAEGTAAQPKTYTWTADNSSESSETVPSGLAATILAERAGSLLSERMTIRLGSALPQLGDAIVETEGTVFLQSFDVDCGSLTAELNFGVPEYLAPEDMAALLSNFRNKCTTSSASMRKTGKTEDKSKNKVELGGIKPLSSSEFAPGTKAKTTFKSLSGTGGSISLDSSELGSSESISVHELTLTDADGEEKTVKFLASEDLDFSDITGEDTPAAVSVDNVSIDHASSSDDDDGNVIQIKDFDNSESDGSQGLCERISVEKVGDDSFKLSSDASDVWILARVNGALKYIPLSGTVEPDEDETDDDEECHDHPGDADGVDPDQNHGGGGGVAGDGSESGDGSASTGSTGSGVGVENPSDGETVIESEDDEEPYQIISSEDEPSGGVSPSGGEGHSQTSCGDCN